MKKSIGAAIALIAYSFAFSAQGQAVSQVSNQTVMERLEALQQTVDRLTETIQSQQNEIRDLKHPGGPKEPASPLPDHTEPPGSSATLPSQLQSSTAHLPDFGIAIDVTGTSTQNKDDTEGNDRISLRELELSFGHEIDPYARMDVVVTLSDEEDPAVEEAAMTYWGLPFDIKGRIGRMRPQVGKASASHRYTLDTVDEPLVVQRYFGPEGFFRTGLELSAFIPFSLKSYTQEFVFGVLEGGTPEGELFGDVRRHPTGYAHLAQFFELSERNSLELGTTYIWGSAGENSRSGVDVFGLDVTLFHSFNSINQVKFLGEIYYQDREDPVVTADSNPYGLYGLIDYRPAERWGIGARYDYVQPTFEPTPGDKAYSAYLTFYQTELVKWRFQYQRANANGDNDNRFFLQGTFATDTHKHFH